MRKATRVAASATVPSERSRSPVSAGAVSLLPSSASLLPSTSSSTPRTAITWRRTYRTCFDRTRWASERSNASDLARDGCVAVEHGEAAPREPEPDVRMEASPGELQVVREHQEEPDGDEEREPCLEGNRAHNADRAGAHNRDTGKRDKNPVGDLRAQRSPVQLVEGVRTDSDSECERGDNGAEPLPSDDGREAATDDDVGQVPRRVGRMEQRHVVPPAAALERVPGRTGDLLNRLRHDVPVFRPRMTTAAPRLSRLTSTPWRPAACHHSSWRSSGWRFQKSRIDPPRKSPTSRQPFRRRRPVSGSTAWT